MLRKIINQAIGLVFIAGCFTACIPTITPKKVSQSVPETYNNLLDTLNTANVNWKDFFNDPSLNALIDTALKNNQDLNITFQEIRVAQNIIMARKGAYLPFVDLLGGVSAEKVGRYTTKGATEANIDIEPGKQMPDPVPNIVAGAFMSWEVDIWRKLRNAKEAAVYRYLSTVEGKNFRVTNLVAEIATSYYELMALDNQLEILKRNIEIQTNVLEIVRLQKLAAKVTELAVRRFEALVFNTKSRQYGIQQRIIEAENRINFLVGRFPQPILRSSNTFASRIPNAINTGIPSQLLINRPDIKQAELELRAASLDVNVARKNFYPSLFITAGVGLEAFNPKYFIKAPESMLYSMAGNLVGPLINRNAIKADYLSANAKQIESVYNYERTILNAYLEVRNQIANISNLESSYGLKTQEVEALTQSVTIANRLFKSAMADYMEVLLTQRDALESTMEQIEIKKNQMNATVKLYQTLGGGWK